MRFFYKLVLLTSVLFSSLLLADVEPNNDCANAERITVLDNIAGNNAQAIIGGTVRNRTPRDTGDLYVFKPNKDGYVSITVNNHGYNRVYFRYSIATAQCTLSNHNQLKNLGSSIYNGVYNLKIEPNQMVYVYVYTEESSLRNYTITASFTKERDFEIRNPETTRNIKGNIAVIGNTVLCPKNNRGECIESPNYPIDRYSVDPPSNSELDLKHVNLHGATGTFPTSSSARLSIPDNATVVWAGLYAQGYLKGQDLVNSKNIMSNNINVRMSSGNYSLSHGMINFRNNVGMGYTYGTYIPFQNIIGLKGYHVNGDVITMNIPAYEGKDDTSGLGNSGAWSLVVVYEDENQTLKNISVFDGFREISNNPGHKEVNITISGFLTPSSGAVNSTLSFFAGEGDKYIEGDDLLINGVQLVTPSSGEEPNIMDSSIVGVPIRNPKIINNQGIDIQNHDISNIVKNGDTTATITLTSKQDTYFPIMIAFTTELYEPRVCYVRELLNEHGNASAENVKNGDIITVRTWFTNLPQLGIPAENAKKVQITLKHDTSTLQYNSETTKIKNVGQASFVSTSDAPNDDLNTYNSTSDESYWNLGAGATSTDGGEFVVNGYNVENLKAFVDYKAKINAPATGSGSITIGGQYKISYEDSTSGIRFGDGSPLAMGTCSAMKDDLSYSNPSGLYNIVNENFSGTTNSDNGNLSQNTLYTQIAGKGFNVKLLSLSSTDKKTLAPITSNVKIELIQTPNPYNDDSCKAATPLHNFGNFTLNNEKSIEISNIAYPEATKGVSFKITDLNSTDLVSCSRDPDGFTIRPAKFKVDNPSSRLIGGKSETVKIKALSYTEATTTKYNQYITNILVPQDKIKLNKPTGCTKDYINNEFSKNGAGNFVNGIANMSVKYNNIGNISITIRDANWTLKDKDKSACRSGSSNDHNGGKVGCDIETEVSFMFYPHTLNASLELKNFDSRAFTYISENSSMYSPIDIDITAVLHDNRTATNYQTNCWARDVTYNIDVSNDVDEWVYPGPNNDVLDRILFFEVDKNKIEITNNSIVTNGSISLETKKENFVNGVAGDLIVGLNFNRSANTPQNPFTVNASKVLSLSNIQDTDNINAARESNLTGESQFYYGRVDSIDYKGSSPITATMRYEGYCDGCDRDKYTNRGNGALSNVNRNEEDPRWCLNLGHGSSNAGNITNLNQVTDASIGINPKRSTAISINGGTERVTLTHANPPYTDDIEIHTQDWLFYDKKNDGSTISKFNVEFLSSGGGWAGVGQVRAGNQTGRVIQRESSNSTSQSMDW